MSVRSVEAGGNGLLSFAGQTFEKLDEATTEMLGTGVGAVSPDGRTLVTGAGWRLTTQSEYDGHHELHVWRLPTP